MKLQNKEINNIVKSLIPEMESCRFSSDLRTSPASYSFICLNIHIIDWLWNLHTYTKYMEPFLHQHTGMDISLDLKEMIIDTGSKKYPLPLYTITDNASN